jgi:uncharacterized delta-60 repeat protein
MKPFIKTALCLALSFPAASPPPATADQTTNAPFAIDQTVYCIALQTDGKVIIGGDFTMTAAALRGHVARLNADGSTDFTFMNNLAGANTTVYSTALQQDGTILIGGIFRFVNGTARIGLAGLNTNGVLNMSFNAVTGSAPFAVQADGRVVTSTALLNNTGTQDTLYRLNPNGTRDTNWLVTITGGTASALALQADGKIVVAGTYAQVNGVNRMGLARLNTDGTTDTTFENGMSGVPGLLNCVAIQPDGKVLIGGYFFQVNGVSRTRIARLNSDGSVDAGFQNGMAGTDGEVETIAVQPDGKVLIGGFFTSVNNTHRPGVARLNSDGSLDNSFLNGMAGPQPNIVYALVLQPDGRVIIGGGFTAVNGVSRYRIARLNADGSVDPLFHNGGQPLLSNLGIQSNHFAFQVSGPSNQVIVVEASANLRNWLPLATNTLSGGPLLFSDPSPASLPMRFYRARVE